MKKFCVYCAHPISGLTWDEVYNYYINIKEKLASMGFDVLHPMTAKGAIRTDVKERFKPAGYNATTPMATNHAIFGRDNWMVQQSDILYLDLTGVSAVSIGSVMELAVASLLGKYTVVVMEENNVHRHAFVMEAAKIVFEDAETALNYMKKLIDQEI